VTFLISREQKDYALMIGKNRNDAARMRNAHNSWDEKIEYKFNCDGALGEILFADQNNYPRPVVITYNEATLLTSDVAGYEIKTRVNDYIKHQLWINCRDVDGKPSRPVVLLKICADYETYSYLGWMWSDDIPVYGEKRVNVRQADVYVVDADLLGRMNDLPKLVANGAF